MATACVAATENEIDTLLDRALHLGVAIANHRAIAFYLNNGFGEPERYMLTKILPPLER